MNLELNETLIKLRILVGYLGEKNQHGWWQSSFLSPERDAFLGPVFPRTIWLAACQGVNTAAAKVHDERIGIGSGVYHLFRLPESLEQELYEMLYDKAVTERLPALIEGPEKATAALTEIMDKGVAAQAGPVALKKTMAIDTVATWKTAAMHYFNAFSTKSHSFPYLQG